MFRATLAQALADLLQVVDRGLPGPFFPGEDAHGHDPVELQAGQCAEERVPVHLALADVQVLVNARGSYTHRRAAAGAHVDDVAQAGRCPEIQGVRDMNMGEQVPCVFHDPGDVTAHIEGVGGRSN